MGFLLVTVTMVAADAVSFRIGSHKLYPGQYSFSKIVSFSALCLGVWTVTWPLRIM